MESIDELMPLLQNLSPECLKVFSEIAKTGNQGIEMKELKMKTEISQTLRMNQHLKALEGRKAIKVVSNAYAKSKKRYILANLTASSEATNTEWYNEDGTFNEGLASEMFASCMRVVSGNLKPLSTDEVYSQLLNEGLESKFGKEEVDTILNALVLDMELETITEKGGNQVFFANHTSFRDEFTPCENCPIREVCEINGDVRPQVCEYLNDWITL